MRTNLQVPFAEKDEAKRLGARWDATRKTWYIENVPDAAAFAKWLPTADAPPPARGTPTKSAPTGKAPSTGNRIIGSDFVAHTRVCDCLPWEVCEKCQSTALSI